MRYGWSRNTASKKMTNNIALLKINSIFAKIIDNKNLY